MIFFDLPVVEEFDRKAYTKFRKFLVKDGYEMIQYSVYSRLCANKDAAKKHLNRVIMNSPRKGMIRALTLTEKQYEDMIVIIGSPTKQEMKINDNRLVVF